MKIIYQTALLALFFFTGLQGAFSQQQNWTVESPLVSINGNDVELVSVLAKQGDSLTWEQHGYNTDNSNTFAVTSATGSWDAQSQTGALSYGLSIDGGTATLVLTGTEEGISATLTIEDAVNGNVDTYTFLVDSTTNL